MDEHEQVYQSEIRILCDRVAQRGYSLKLTFDPGCGLGEDLKPL